MAISVVQELYAPSPSRAVLLLVRGIALRAQTLRMGPAAFDCPNGRDALAAIATATSREQLTQIANGNAFVLGARWSKIVYIASTEIPGDAIGDIERCRAADITPSANRWTPPKLFAKWMP
jgi:hypothetical protein